MCSFLRGTLPYIIMLAFYKTLFNYRSLLPAAKRLELLMVPEIGVEPTILLITIELLYLLELHRLIYCFTEKMIFSIPDSPTTIIFGWINSKCYSHIWCIIN